MTHLKLINLTPHTVKLVNELGVLEVFPTGTVARVSSTQEEVGRVIGVPLVRATFGAVTGLPDPVEGTLYIVSALVRAALPGRADLASPGDLVRDEAGNVVGAKSLIVNSSYFGVPAN
jgi:hypothetical protein